MSEPRTTPPGTPEATPEPAVDEQGLAPAEQLAGNAAPRRWSLFRRRARATVEQPAAPDHPEAADPNAPGPAPEKTPEPLRISTRKQRREAERAARRTPPPITDRSGWAICGVAVLGALVLLIVGVGLNTALGALQDMARAAHIDQGAADLYWIGVDGLIVVAIIAAMILRHDPVARRYAMFVVAAFTVASGILQYLHGLGWTTPDPRTGAVKELPWGVVLVVAVLVIGTVFCGTHLFVYVLRHLFPRTLADQGGQAVRDDAPPVQDAPEPSSADSDTEDGSPTEDRSEPPLLDAETEREIRKWFAACAVSLLLEAGVKPVRSKIARSFEIADRQAGYVIADVVADREDAAARAAELEAAGATGNGHPSFTVAANGSAVNP